MAKLSFPAIEINESTLKNKMEAISSEIVSSELNSLFARPIKHNGTIIREAGIGYSMIKKQIDDKITQLFLDGTVETKIAEYLETHMVELLNTTITELFRRSLKKELLSKYNGS